MSVSLFIAGDVVPRKGQSENIEKISDSVFDAMRPYISGADMAIVNLEAPIITDKQTPIKKSGPCLYTSKSTIEALKEVGFGGVTLANNHFFDQGQNGVDNTIDICNFMGVKTMGGGKTYLQARKPLFLELNSQVVALINSCEHEFSIADSTHGGSNPLDLINMQEDIATARKKADYVVLIIHGGIEQYHYPTPRMKRWFRHFVDLGADAVINHHQHCINGYEVYNGKPIFYGLGNFYFPKTQSRPESWQYGYAVRLILDSTIDFELIPYKQTSESITLRDRSEFEKEIELFNLPIADDFLLLQKLDEFIIDRENIIKMALLPSFLSNNRLSSALVRRGYFGRLYNGKQVLSLKNKLTCETHYELLQRLFTILTK